jgi:formylglycine-generating enzyme required for sulfatase activity
MGFELPYAAEWRWFALADAPADLAANPAAFAVTAWFKQNADGDRHPVKQLAANAFGLHDTQGNVWELCLADGETWSDSVARTDAKSSVRPYLGGSCSSSADRCRIAKAELAHDGAGATRGFRPVFRVPRSR